MFLTNFILLLVKANYDFVFSVSCLSETVAKTIERSMNIDIQLFDGFKLLRNEKPIKARSAKSLDEWQRLTNAISNFLDTHTVSIDLTEGRSLEEDTQESGKAGGGGGGLGGGNSGGGGGKRRRGGNKGGDNGGLFNMNSEAIQREKKYYQYAFMVLLGIFGLTGPLFMKLLGVIAAKALLAAKAALIIVGGVALKKIFEKGDHKPKVKVHTVPVYESLEDHHEHDRYGHEYKHLPLVYSSPKSDNSPYSAYYSEGTNDIESEFAPILYGSQYKSKNLKTR